MFIFHSDSVFTTDIIQKSQSLTAGTRNMVDKKRIRQLIKISCIIQTLNAAIDAILWFTKGFQVPSWTISTLVIGYSVILIAYDRV